MTAKAPTPLHATGETRLDGDVTVPPTTKPGDAPADTTDPLERASTVTPNPGEDALAVGVVNGVVTLEPIVPAKVAPDDFEEYDVTLPTGKPGRVKRNMTTGKSELVPVAKAAPVDDDPADPSK